MITQPCLPGRRRSSVDDNTALLAWEKEEESGGQHSSVIVLFRMQCNDVGELRFLFLMPVSQREKKFAN